MGFCWLISWAPARAVVRCSPGVICSGHGDTKSVGHMWTLGRPYLWPKGMHRVIVNKHRADWVSKYPMSARVEGQKQCRIQMVWVGQGLVSRVWRNVFLRMKCVRGRWRKIVWTSVREWVNECVTEAGRQTDSQAGRQVSWQAAQWRCLCVQLYGPKPLNSTRRHEPFWGLPR